MKLSFDKCRFDWLNQLSIDLSVSWLTERGWLAAALVVLWICEIMWAVEVSVLARLFSQCREPGCSVRLDYLSRSKGIGHPQRSASVKGHDHRRREIFSFGFLFNFSYLEIQLYALIFNGLINQGPVLDFILHNSSILHMSQHKVLDISFLDFRNFRNEGFDITFQRT